MFTRHWHLAVSWDQTAETGTKLSENKKMLLKTLKEGTGNIANKKGATDEQTWWRLRLIAIVLFGENLLIT